MELAIPWSLVFADDPESRDTVVTVGGVRDTLRWFPPGQRRLKICAVHHGRRRQHRRPGFGPRQHPRAHQRRHRGRLHRQLRRDRARPEGRHRARPRRAPTASPTGAWDPATAPRAGGSGSSYEVPDRERALRARRPRVQPARLRPGPRRAARTSASSVTPPWTRPTRSTAGSRTVDLSANVFDMRGRFVRNLYIYQPAERDARSDRVAGARSWTPGTAATRAAASCRPASTCCALVIEPNLSRQTRSVVVVR